MFSARLSLTDLIDLCRVLRHQLAAGLSIHQVIKQQAERGRRSFRAIAGRVSEAIQRGTSFSDALDGDKAAFPPLFLAMVKLGESTGHMAEIFGEMERYFQMELQLRRQYFTQTLWPKVQFVFATLIVAGVMALLGFLGSLNPAVPHTFFGLTGGAAALTFLGAIYGTLFALWASVRLLKSMGRQQVWMDRLVLRIPIVGPCLRSLVMSRFTLALQLTLDTGLSIAKALRLSLESTGNAYFASGAGGIALSLKNGCPLHEALQTSGFFDADFIDMVMSGEEGGRVPEMMRHLAEQYQDETKRRMTTVTGLAAGAIAVGVAGFIIFFIFYFFINNYLGMINNIR